VVAISSQTGVHIASGPAVVMYSSLAGTLSKLLAEILESSKLIGLMTRVLTGTQAASAAAILPLLRT
jgi:hypothetical protein